MVTPIPVESDFEGASIGGIRRVGKGGVCGTSNAHGLQEIYGIDRAETMVLEQ